MTLREMRERAGLRQEDVGKKLGVDQTAVCKWEKGVSRPLKKYRKKLAKLYGVPLCAGCAQKRKNAAQKDIQPPNCETSPDTVGKETPAAEEVEGPTENSTIPETAAEVGVPEPTDAGTIDKEAP